MVTVRSTVPPWGPKIPARYHTCPDWPSAALAPVVSRAGLRSAGTDRDHCHQDVLNSSQLSMNCFESAGTTTESALDFPPATTIGNASPSSRVVDPSRPAKQLNFRRDMSHLPNVK